MMNRQQLEDLIAEVHRLVLYEQQLVASGRLEEVVSAIQQRQQLVAQIPMDQIPEGEILESLRQVQEEGDKTLTLLCAIRDELADQLGEGQDVRHAVGQYAGSSRH